MTLAMAACLVLPLPARAAADIKVVVSIKPLHALVAGVMAGVASPRLLVDGAASPHTYALKPSDARALHQADLVFRMSETVEPFTVKVVRSLPDGVGVVTLMDTPGLRLLSLRTGATFEHAGDKGHSTHGHGGKHGGGTVDGHAWLDPGNAKVMVERIRQALSAKYPAHAALFARNAGALRQDLDALEAELHRRLAPVAGKPYIVFHDALQYFEQRFGLNVVGAIAISPDIPPSAKRLTELRRRIRALGAMCVFAEPQFDTRLVENLVEGTDARTGTLDPEGGRLPPGRDLYFALMRRLAEDLRGCLAAPA
jgi:zinc transport system substrate-binding protein